MSIRAAKWSAMSTATVIFLFPSATQVRLSGMVPGIISMSVIVPGMGIDDLLLTVNVLELRDIGTRR